MVPEGSEPAIGERGARAQYDHDRTLVYDGESGELIAGEVAESNRLTKAAPG